MEQNLLPQLEQGRACILVVDDDIHICAGLRDILEDSGYGVATANSAEDARLQFQRQPFSVMIVDYSLPDANGVQLAQEARLIDPLMEIVLMSGHDQLEIPEKTKHLFALFLKKPADIQTVLAATEQAILRRCAHLNVRYGAAKPVVLPEAKRVMISSRSFAMAGLLIGGFGMGWLSREALQSIQSLPPLTLAAPVEAVQLLVAPPPVTRLAATPPVVTAPEVRPAKRTAARKIQLRDADPTQRLKAAKALLKLDREHREALTVLFALLKDADAGQRLAAVEALSAVKAAGPTAVMALTEALKDEDSSVAYAAKVALGRLDISVPSEPAPDAAIVSASNSLAALNADQPQESLDSPPSLQH